MMADGPTLVTGANGFVGRHLTSHLRATGDTNIVGWSRQQPSDTSGASWREVDVLDRDAVYRAITVDRPSRIVHLAGAPHVGDSWRNALPTLQVNVLGTRHLLDAVQEACPSARVLVVTSGMIYQPGAEALDEAAPLVPTNPYGMSKLAQDQLARLMVEEQGLHVVVARPFNHIGPGQDPSFAASSFARQIALIEAGRRDPVLQVGNLDAERDLTDVRDVVSAYRLLLDRGQPGTAVNVCSGRARRIGWLLDTLVGLSSVPIEVTHDPARLRPSDTPRLLGNRERLTMEFGWAPTIPLEQTLADTLAWWRDAVRDGHLDN
jgi:GDP-4-dehydro-6-deoxy-D-mannose reductase